MDLTSRIRESQLETTQTVRGLHEPLKDIHKELVELNKKIEENTDLIRQMIGLWENFARDFGEMMSRR